MQALVFDWHYPDPEGLIRMSPRRVMFWAAMAKDWQAFKTKIADKAKPPAQQKGPVRRPRR